MQCGVGTLKHGLEESPVHWISGYADTTCRFIALIATGGKQRAEGRIKFLRLFLRQTFRLHIPEQDKKFIVTDPADIVRTPEYPPQDSRDIVQHNIPELPPPCVVDPFKVIHINNKHRMGLAHVAFQKTQIYQILNRHLIVASREAIPVRRFFLNQHGLLAFRHTHCPLPSLCGGKNPLHQYAHRRHSHRMPKPCSNPVLTNFRIFLWMRWIHSFQITTHSNNILHSSWQTLEAEQHEAGGTLGPCRHLRTFPVFGQALPAFFGYFHGGKA